MPGVKSTAIVQIDATMFMTRKVTININGKSHVLEGQVSRREPQLVEFKNGRPPFFIPGLTIWQGDNGMVSRYDAGSISGELIIDGQRYVIDGNPIQGGSVFVFGMDRQPRDRHGATLNRPRFCGSSVQRSTAMHPGWLEETSSGGRANWFVSRLAPPNQVLGVQYSDRER